MRRLGAEQFTPGQRNLLSGGSALGIAFVEPLLSDKPMLLGVGTDLVEPAGDLNALLRQAGRDSRCEGAALDHGGYVGTVGDENAFEHAARFGQVMGLGDDEREVLTFTSGHGHVQATPRRRRRGERDAARGRVAFGARLGGGIREL